MKKILLVEDEPELSELLGMIIESEFDNEIVNAASGNEACKLLDSSIGMFGVIISDYNMDDGNGGHIYLHNKEKENVPFILLSGGMIEDYAEFQGFDSHNTKNSFVEKPFEEEIIVSCIKKALD